MRHLPRKTFRFCMIAICSAIVANGCVFPRDSLPVTTNRLEPGQYCPGDTLRASFDFLGSETCMDIPDGPTCMAGRPEMIFSSSPEAFPRTFTRDYLGHIDFVPVGDRVDVTFDIDRAVVEFPTSRSDDRGMRIIASRPTAGDQTKTATRIAGSIDTTLTHAGVCNGSTPAHAPASLLASATSPNLRIRRLCNTSSVPVMATLSGSAPGTNYSQTLNPGECLDPSMPGVPSGIDASTMVEVRSLIAVDPAVRCNATTSAENRPPAPITMLVSRSCG